MPLPQPAPENGSVLSARDLQLAYGKTTVVHGASLQLQPGKVTALVGPNGSGKSTLLRALARLHRSESGEVWLSTPAAAAQPTWLFNPKEFAREVTLFAQSRPAPQGLTVADIVAFGRHPYRRRFAGLTPEDYGAIDRALAITGISTMASRDAGELSGGEMQRVWLAACLAQQTGVVLLDEPTNHLDMRYQVETLAIVRDLAEKHHVAVGIVLHDLNHAAYVADEIVLLAKGKIHACGPAPQVLTQRAISEVYGVSVHIWHDEATDQIRVDALKPRPRNANNSAGQATTAGTLTGSHTN